MIDVWLTGPDPGGLMVINFESPGPGQAPYEVHGTPEALQSFADTVQRLAWEARQ